jgi:agmatinase
VFLPVPFDLTSTWRKGADRGPEAILDASPNLEFYDIETDSEVYKKGIFTDSPITADNSRSMIQNVRHRIKSHLENKKFVVTVGGEHSVSIGSVEAHSNECKNLTVLQLDAHTDLRDEYNGSRFNHACVMSRIRELCPIVQVGIRSMDITEKARLDDERIFYAHNIVHRFDWIDAVVDLLGAEVYVTIDLDVFDIGLMPSTGTPEPGGLGWYQVLRLLKAVSEKKRVVGFDVVELCPSKTNIAPDFLAAKLIYTFLSYIWR